MGTMNVPSFSHHKRRFRSLFSNIEGFMDDFEAMMDDRSMGEWSGARGLFFPSRLLQIEFPNHIDKIMGTMIFLRFCHGILGCSIFFRV